MIRSFVAIPLPDSIRERLNSLALRLRKLDIHASFPKSQSMHLTLKFLGNIREDQVPGLGTQLETAVKGRSAFEVAAGGIGVFPHLSKPKVVWVGLQATAELNDLQKSVDEALIPLGFPKERRQFHPHLTLARVKSGRNLARLIDFVESSPDGDEVGLVPVETIQLYRSILSPAGARYQSLAAYALRGK